MAKQKKQFASFGMQLLVKEAKYFGVQVTPLSHDDNLAHFSRGKKSWLVKATVPAVNLTVPSRIATDKFLTNQVLKLAGLQVPNLHLATSLKEAQQLLKKHSIPVVVKPAGGAHGLGVTVGVHSSAELAKAYKKAVAVNLDRGYQQGVVIEDFKKGKDYRFFVIDGHVWAVLLRTPAHVVGDGRLTISALIKKHNRLPDVGSADSFNKPLVEIVIDDELKRNLKEQRLLLTSVPAKGLSVWLRKQANISLGGTGTDVTDLVNPGLKKFAVAIARALGLRIAGVDILIDDVSRSSAREAGAWVIEVNAQPGFDIHQHPWKGTSRPVVTGILLSMFPELTAQARAKRSGLPI
jgi:cyanophycin synthetase